MGAELGRETEASVDLRIKVLGPFRLSVGSNPEAALPPLVARIGCMLAGWPRQWVDRERIVNEVWQGSPPRTVHNALQVHMSHIRKLIGGDRLHGKANAYMLNVEAAAVDAECFQELVSDAVTARRTRSFEIAERLLQQALNLWGGTPYVGIRDPELRARSLRLEELYATAREDWLECRFALARDLHDLRDSIAEARELITRDPLRERGHLLLIRGLRMANRGAEANEALRQAGRILHVADFERLIGETGPG